MAQGQPQSIASMAVDYDFCFDIFQYWLINNLLKISWQQWAVNMCFSCPVKLDKAFLCPNGSRSLTYSHSLTNKHNTYSTTLLLVNSVCSNDSVGLVGVWSFIYLRANINIRRIVSHAGRNSCWVGNLLSFWVTAWLKITPRSGGGKTS